MITCCTWGKNPHRMWLVCSETTKLIREAYSFWAGIDWLARMSDYNWIPANEIWIEEKEDMIPKAGEVVRISEKFVREFDSFDDGSTICHDLKHWVARYRGKDLTVDNLSISTHGGFVVTVNAPGEMDAGEFVLTTNGRLHCWSDSLDVAFFTYDRTSTEATSSAYCSCANPNLKDVFISANINYKFCQTCRKERR